MKKIFLIVLLGLTLPLCAQKLDLNNPKIIENFGANIVKEKLDTYDSVALGLWYLKTNYRSKWDRVKNDEFELDDAKVWAFEQFKKKLNKVPPINKDAEYHLYLSAKFGKYDFKSKRFPVEALVEGTYMSYTGKGEFVSSYYRDSKLEFENASIAYNYIPMSKIEAKKFIKNRKSSGGYVNRDIVAHYIYTIVSYEEDHEFTSDGSAMTLKFMGKLKSVEFMDKKRKNILHTVQYGVSAVPVSSDENLSK